VADTPRQDDPASRPLEGETDTEPPFCGPQEAQDAPKGPVTSGRSWMYRHRLPIRFGHWINVLCLPILIFSGFQIFNAHPSLYWGLRSDRDRPILAMSSVQDDQGKWRGVTTLFGRPFDTTGLFGVSKDSNGVVRRRGLPSWATLPSGQWLAMGRRWHFFFAWIFAINGAIFMAYTVLSGHLFRDLLPTWKNLRGAGAVLRDHLLFRHPEGEEAKEYNVLQKLAYTGVVFFLGPLIILTGLTMSPRMDAGFPFLLDFFHGRQSARSIHFVACIAFIIYTVVHVFMVAVTGLINNLRSMVTGWFRLPE